VGNGDGSVSMLPTARITASILGSVAQMFGSPTSAHQASRAVQPNPANSRARPPRAVAATFGHSRGSSAGIGPVGPWKASESPNTSSSGWGSSVVIR
jgi:hypothetical protein